MSGVYTYSAFNDFPQNTVNTGQFDRYIRHNLDLSISDAIFNGISTDGDAVHIIFSVPLDASELDVLDSFVAAHVPQVDVNPDLTLATGVIYGLNNSSIYFPNVTTNLIGANTMQTITNKTLLDSTNFFASVSNPTKKAQFNLNSISPSTTRTYALPDITGTILVNDGTASTYAYVNNTSLTSTIFAPLSVRIAPSPGSFLAMYSAAVTTSTANNYTIGMFLSDTSLQCTGTSTGTNVSLTFGESLTATAAASSGFGCTLAFATDPRLENGFVPGQSVTMSGFTPSSFNGTYTITAISSYAITYTSVSSYTGVASVMGTVTGAKNPQTFGFVTGQSVTVSGLSPSSFNGTFALTNVTTTQIQYSSSSFTGSSTGTGQVYLNLSGLNGILLIGSDRKVFSTTTASPVIAINQVVTTTAGQILAIYGLSSTGTLTISRQTLNLIKLY